MGTPGSALTDGYEHPGSVDRDKYTSPAQTTNLYVLGTVALILHPISTSRAKLTMYLTDRVEDYDVDGNLLNFSSPREGLSSGLDFVALNDAATLDGETWGAATQRILGEEAKRLALMDADAVATNEPTETAAQSRLE